MHKGASSAITVAAISILVFMMAPTITALPHPIDNSKTISGFGENVEIILLNHTPGHHGPEKGSAILTGIAGVATDATGTVKFSHNKASDPLSFRLVVKNAIDVTIAHIHCANNSADNSVVKTLFNFASPVSTGKGGKAIDSGKFDTVDGGNPCNYSFQDLLFNMRAGTTYIDVHTELHPDGEIRGQITYD